jgi:NADH dehydrogenase FAD-containing subunit
MKTTLETARRHRVAIVGCGFGGLFAAKRLRQADVDVTVIDRTNHHLFQPLLYQVATGILSEGDVAPPIRDVLRHQPNTTVVLGDVVDIDLQARRLRVETVGVRREIAYDSLIIATGASQSYFGHPVVGRGAAAPERRGLAAGAAVDGAGRVEVEADCTLPGHPEVFVIGDLMSLAGLPGLAQVAIQSGRHAADTITRRIAGDATPRPFRYRDRGTMATISRFRAVAVFGRFRASGFFAWILWLGVHLVALTGFKNRISVVLNWTLAFLSGGRPQRVITRQQVFARQALEARPLGTSTWPGRRDGSRASRAVAIDHVGIV